MNKLYYITSLVLISLVCSCTDESTIRIPEDIKVTANILSSRTTYSSENGMTNVSWLEGDAVGLFTKGQINLKYSASNPAEKSRLLPEGEKLQVNEGDSVIAYYPFNRYINKFHPYLDEFVQKGAIPFNSLLNQYQVDGPALYDGMYAVGVVKNNEVALQFKHLFAFLRITFPTKMLTDLSSRSFRLLSTETIGSVSEGTYYPIIGEIDRGGKSNYINYYLDKNLLKEETVTCVIVVYPQTEAATIEIRVITNSSTYNTLLVKSAPKGGFKAGYVYNLNLNCCRFCLRIDYNHTSYSFFL